MASSRAPFCCVVLDRYWHEESERIYRVSFERSDGSSELQDVIRGDERSARTRAHRLARAHALPFVDRTLGDEILRDPDKLDETLQQWAPRLGYLSRPLQEPPEGFPCRIEQDGKRVMIEISSVPFQMRHLGTFLHVAVPLSILWAVFFPVIDENSWVGRIVFISILGLLSFFFSRPSPSVTPFARPLRPRTSVSASRLAGGDSSGREN